VIARTALVMCAAALLVAVAACDDDERYPRIVVTSVAFGPEETIPLRHTCDGTDVSPPLAFDGASDKTVSYAVIMDEPEAASGKFTHWLLWGIPVANGFVGDELPAVENPEGSLVQGTNDADSLGYSGPCPEEEDTEEHRYVIRAYALDTMPAVTAGANRKTLRKALDGHIVGYGKLVGYYKREN
jgi:Raf kinase inhibitor-like YbhB/YbcL family protein